MLASSGEVLRHSRVKVNPLAVPELGSCTCLSALAGEARPEAGPQPSQPLPRVLELAASKATDSTGVGHPGGTPSSSSSRRTAT